MNRIQYYKSEKSTKAELQRRVAIVLELLSRKMKRSEIIEYCLDESLGWDVTPATIGKYINRAKGEITKSVKKSALQNLSESVMDLKELYRKCYQREDYKTALAVRKELNAVLEVSRGSVIDTGTEQEELSDELEAMIKDVTPTRSGRAG